MTARSIRRCGSVGVLILNLSCGFASSALAWRPPTRSEHRVIAGAARETPTAYPDEDEFHGLAAGPRSEQYVTLPGGWRCGVVEQGAAGCSRGGASIGLVLL